MKIYALIGRLLVEGNSTIAESLAGYTEHGIDACCHWLRGWLAGLDGDVASVVEQWDEWKAVMEDCNE